MPGAEPPNLVATLAAYPADPFHLAAEIPSVAYREDPWGNQAAASVATLPGHALQTGEARGPHGQTQCSVG
ncbi:hypothetical protein MMPV_003924 [Pyropia vietnamensis]